MALDEAEDLVRKLYAGDGMHTVDREVAVGHMGYRSLNGASAQVLASLSQYGLLETAGRGQVRLTSLAIDLIEPQSAEDRAKALAQAAYSPKLFAELKERFPTTIPSEANLRAYLIRQQFQPSALKAVIPAYLRTCEYLSAQNASGSPVAQSQHVSPHHQPRDVQHGGMQTSAPSVIPAIRQQPETPSGIRREVFGLEEGEVVITLPTRLSAESIEDIEAWLEIVTRKLRRMTIGLAAREPHSPAQEGAGDEGEGEV